jgi:pimeloyl-ACP methyl ester carboxylesterase
MMLQSMFVISVMRVLRQIAGRLALVEAGMSMVESRSSFRSDEGAREMDEWYAGMLARLQVPYESITVPTRFGATHMLATGPKDAPPVILLHGMEGTALSWRHQLNMLSASYRLYALDIIGSAGKSATIRLPIDGTAHAEWLVDVLSGLGLGMASFIGMSNGSWLIIKLAEYAPEAITHAVLISANGFLPVRFPFNMARLLQTSTADAAMGKVARIITRERVLRSITRTAPKGLAVDPDEMEWFYLLAKHYRYRFPPPPATDAQLRALTAPTVLLMGEKEQFFLPCATIARARAHLPNLHLAEVVSGVGHNMATDDPPRINSYIHAFLSRSSEARDITERERQAS